MTPPFLLLISHFSLNLLPSSKVLYYTKATFSFDSFVSLHRNGRSRVEQPSISVNSDRQEIADQESDDSPVKQPSNSVNSDRQALFLLFFLRLSYHTGELHLYPVSVKTFGGEKLKLQLNPVDSVMDVRQFLLDAPETCYDLLLHTKDGVVHPLEDYNEISEVADITTGDCSLEMVSGSAAYYDDRSVRVHVHRTRELLSVSTLHASLSMSLALQHEKSLNTSDGKQEVVKAIPELDDHGFMEDVTSCLSKMSSSSSKEINCVESLVFSSLNPPPSYRRLVGDLIYLDVITLEGVKYCITGTTRVFYVNSTGKRFRSKAS